MDKMQNQTMMKNNKEDVGSRPSSSLLDELNSPKKLTATELDRLYESALS